MPNRRNLGHRFADNLSIVTQEGLPVFESQDMSAALTMGLTVHDVEWPTP